MDRGDSLVRILLAHGQPIIRTGLRSLLERVPDFRIVGQAGNLQEAVELAHRADPDLLLLDTGIAGLLEGSLPERFSPCGREIRSFVLAQTDGKEEIARAFRMGARGVVLKESSTRQLIQGIHAVMEGKFWVVHESSTVPSAASLQIQEGSAAAAPSRTFGLTRREMEVVAAIMSGYSNREISEKFSISEGTVKHHVTNIFDKLGIYNRLELVLFAIHHGLAAEARRIPPSRKSGARR